MLNAISVKNGSSTCWGTVKFLRRYSMNVGLILISISMSMATAHDNIKFVFFVVY